MEPQTHWDLKMYPWDNRTPRYYPPGQHPATYRWRWTLAKALECGLGDDHEMVVYLREQIAAFEQAESDLKAQDDYMLRHP